MYIELDNENRFVQYHENKENVAPEHKNNVLEVTENLYKLLQDKKPWKINIVENKVYDVQDIEKFVEIIVVQPKSEIEMLKETVDALVLANLGVQSMFETLLRLWKEGRLPEIGLDRAVTKGWITEEQKVIIMAQVPEQ